MTAKRKTATDSAAGGRSSRPVRKPRVKKFLLDRRADLIDPAAGSDVMTTHECADFLRVSHQWLEIHRVDGDGPPFLRVGSRHIRYSRAAILEWLSKRSHTSTGEYA
jgi:hypothetical protein